MGGDPRHLFADGRLGGGCVYCGQEADTRDHVPSLVLLDDPLPPDLPTIAACSACNQGFSLDEEYLACLVDCTLSGSADPSDIRRNKVKRTLERNDRLAERIRLCMSVDPRGTKVWKPEDSRIQSVIVKMARGHADYELGVGHLDEPESCEIIPLIALSAEARSEFENDRRVGPSGWPEIGSRAFIRAEKGRGSSDGNSWITTQERRYRYRVDQDDGVCVSMVLSEYLACIVGWT